MDMGLSPAPTFAELNTKKETQPIEETPMPKPTELHDFSVDGVVTFKLIGAGGAGKVAAIRYSQSAPSPNKVMTIDTSGVTDTVSDVESYRIKDLNGSGKLRRENIEPIQNFITDLTTKSEFDDVNVIVMSLSGGSGSVLGPLLVEEILRQGKIVIVLGIIDTSSEVDTINALNSLRTLDNITEARKGYVPTILFDNRYGRSVVDKGLAAAIDNLCSILNFPYIGLDMQDRIKFLNPNVFGGVEPGLKMLNISKISGGEWDEFSGMVTTDTNSQEKIDATMIITPVGVDLNLSTRSVVNFQGYFNPEHGGEQIVASIGYQIPEALIKGLNAHIHGFKSTIDKPKTKIEAEYEIGETRGKIIL